MSIIRPLIVSSLVAALASGALAGVLEPRISVGDVIGGRAAILVSPATGTGVVTVEIARDELFTDVVSSQQLTVDNALVPGRAIVTGLAPGAYFARVVEGQAVRTARFVMRAAPVAAASADRGVRFGVTGDWRGDVGLFTAIGNADERRLDFFVKLGDTVYADVPSPAVPNGPAATLDEFRAKHVENYAPSYGIDPWGELTAVVPTFASIDDHEVTNDFDGGAFDGTSWFNQGSLYVNGLQAFVEHNPLVPAVWPVTGNSAIDARMAGRPDLYRSFAWGSDASVFMLDARSFRDASLAPVSNPFDPAQVTAFITASYNPARTMLGSAQIQRLLTDLATAQARGVTWKFIMTSMPMQNFGPLAGEDRWEGYAAERAYILQQILALGLTNVVFVTADFHGTIVNDVTVINPSNPSQQLFTGTFEIVTGSLAYSAPAGPTFAQLGLSTGAITQQQFEYYQSLPNFGKDQFIGQVLDQVVGGYGYSPTGIQDPSIDETFLVGGSVALHHYGWTEFDIHPLTKDLLLTTYGVDWYSPAEVVADAQSIIARPITIRQQFKVKARGILPLCPGDLNGDRVTEGADLASLLGAWGDCEYASCPADFNGSGVVDSEDLAFMLAAWQGDCSAGN